MEDFQENLSEVTQYQEGFNDSYLIAKNLPELSDRLSNMEEDTPFLQGFKDGREQFIHELEKERYPDWLQKDRFKDYDHSEDRSKGKDLDEPDIS